MNGIINCALQGFIEKNHGPELWSEVRGIARLPAEGFEAMRHYDDALTLACFAALVDMLNRHPNDILEDIGTYLVTHPELEPLRRLLRFGGGTFGEFLLSLEELPDRARLAIPDLEMPSITLRPLGMGQYLIMAAWPLPGIAPVLMGALRAMADDYGALAIVELAGVTDGQETLRAHVFDTDFSAGRAFSLGGAAS